MKFFASILLTGAFLLCSQMTFAKADVTDLYTNAVMTADVAALEELLAPNYWNIANNGHIRDKAHFIKDIKDKILMVDRITFTNTRETKVGDTRLLTGTGIFRGKSDIPRPEGLMRYTMVTANNNGKEQVVLFQATPVISTKECPEGNCKID